MKASKKVRIAFSSLALTVRAIEHDSFHIGCLTSTVHEDMNAGQAARTSSRSQPGSAAKVVGTICNGADGGGVEVPEEDDGVDGVDDVDGGVAGVGVVGRGVPGLPGGSGVVVQAASESATAVSGTSRLRRVKNDMRIAMWILMLEACVAFFLLVFIVWWTMYQGKSKTKKLPPSKQDDEQN